MDVQTVLNVLGTVYKIVTSIKGIGDIIKGLGYITVGTGKLGNWLLSVFGYHIPNQLMGLIMILASGIIFWNLSKDILKFLLYYIAFLFAISLIITIVH